jgi:hypothetical protein
MAKGRPAKLATIRRRRRAAAAWLRDMRRIGPVNAGSNPIWWAYSRSSRAPIAWKVSSRRRWCRPGAVVAMAGRSRSTEAAAAEEAILEPRVGARAGSAYRRSGRAGPGRESVDNAWPARAADTRSGPCASRHGACADNRRPIIRIDARHQRQVAGPVAHGAGQLADGLLAFRQGVKIAHAPITATCCASWRRHRHAVVWHPAAGPLRQSRAPMSRIQNAA